MEIKMGIEGLELGRIIEQFRKQQATVMIEQCKDGGERKRDTKDLMDFWLASEGICRRLEALEKLGIKRLNDCDEWLQTKRDTSL